MKYYLKKILGFIFTILLVSIITFVVFQILPGDPAQIILGVDADPAQLENLRATMNLDKGYVERYFIWLINALHGDLGVSYRYSREVSDLIAERRATNRKCCFADKAGCLHERSRCFRIYSPQVCPHIAGSRICLCILPYQVF